MTIHEIRLLPPFAIARLGTADTPLDNFSIVIDSDRQLGFRKIVPAETLVVSEKTGEIELTHTPEAIEFKTKEGRIRPVAPFIEIWARLDKTSPKFVPLTLEILEEHGLTPADISWHVRVENRKVERRTGDQNDRVEAEARLSDHGKKRLRGKCNNFLSAEHTIDFGSVRYIKPNDAHPELRLRFTPATGLIYGPKLTKEELAKLEQKDPDIYVVPEKQVVYDTNKGSWWHFAIPPGVRNADPNADFYNETLPPALFAIDPPAPCWLNDNVAVSRGYFDDACDGIVEVTLTSTPGKKRPDKKTRPGKKQGRDEDDVPTVLTATSRIIAAPPAPIPDSLFVRSLADDLDQAIFGPEVPADESVEVTRARAEDIVRRAFETVRFLNVAVLNGNPVDGRDPLDFDTMPAEEAFDVWRLMRPVFPPQEADTLAIMALHQRVYSAMRGGAAPWFSRLIRRPNQVADFTDTGRRKMPALMAGADGSYLALTHRQIDTIEKAATRPSDLGEVYDSVEADSHSRKASAVSSRLIPRNASARRAAELHHVAQGNPVSSRPITAIGNCTPGLEVDFRAVWRRVFEGIVLREYDNLVLEADAAHADLVRHRLLRIEYPRPDDGYGVRFFLTMTTQIGPSPADPTTQAVVLAYQASPNGLAPLEWSNLLASILHERAGQTVTCYFTAERSELDMVDWHDDDTHIKREFKVRDFFEGSTAMISRELAEPGELTQGLCSPWHNDYRECSCYYWASARPDFVNVEAGPAGRAQGDNWFQKERTGSYVADDYADERLVLYDDLFHAWEQCIRFVIGGKDHGNLTELRPPKEQPQNPPEDGPKDAPKKAKKAKQR